MKKLLLLPFALLIMGVLFFGCEKDPALENEKNTTPLVEHYATERGHISCCNSSLNYCSTCGSLTCCIRIELSFTDPNVTDLLSKYKYCKSWDASSTCEIDEGDCFWLGVDGDLCVGNNYICVPEDTGFSVFNTSQFAGIRVHVFYPATASIPTSVANIQPRETVAFEFNGCSGIRECE